MLLRLQVFVLDFKFVEISNQTKVKSSTNTLS